MHCSIYAGQFQGLKVNQIYLLTLNVCDLICETKHFDLDIINFLL